MKRSRTLARLLVPAVFLLLFVARSSTAAATDEIEVHGKVVSAVTGKPVRQAEVELRRPRYDDRYAPLNVTADRDGEFVVRFAPAHFGDKLEQVTISAKAEGFALAEQPLFAKDAAPTSPVNVTLTLTATTLNAILDIFSCCILNWGVLTVVLPAFFLASAIKVFIPSHHFLRYLGPKAPAPMAYGAAVGSGAILSLCSCNVVPLFVSIWRSGAGIGPAFAFLYAGPAISVISAVFTARVIGLGIAAWRIAVVAGMATLVGTVMALVFARRDGRDAAATPAVAAAGPRPAPAVSIGALLLALLVLASLDLSLGLRLALTLPVGAALLAAAVLWLGRDYLVAWLRETGVLLWKTVPILIPAILLMGYLAGKTPVSATRWISGSNSFAVNLGAAGFGSLMYFPIMTEVAFAKTLLKVVNVGIGPAMALLLTGPGLSLPGMIIVGREIGLKKLLLYVIVIILLATLIGMFFGSSWGKYLCSCKLD